MLLSGSSRFNRMAFKKQKRVHISANPLISMAPGEGFEPPIPKAFGINSLQAPAVPEILRDFKEYMCNTFQMLHLYPFYLLIEEKFPIIALTFISGRLCTMNSHN